MIWDFWLTVGFFVSFMCSVFALIFGIEALERVEDELWEREQGEEDEHV